jgi:integrase
VGLIGEALSVPQDEKPGANDRSVFASKFEGVTALARHSLSQAVRRVVTDKKLAAFTPHDLRRTGATIAQAARLPVDFAGTCSKKSAKPSWRLKRPWCR